MAAPVNVSPGGQNTHHVKIGSDIGLILCNRNGDIDPLAYHPSPTNSALQIRQGEQSYQDEAQPWSLKNQNDWSGGRGSENIEKAINKYYDGNRINTARDGQVIPSGWDSYGLYRNGAEYWKGCLGSGNYRQNFDINNAAANYMFASPFLASSSFTAAKLWIWVRAVGTPSDMTVYFYTNDGATKVPDTSSGGAIIPVSTYGDGLWNLAVVDVIGTVSITSGSRYWIALEDDDSGTTDYWEWACSSEALTAGSGYVNKKSTDVGVNWSTSGLSTHSPFFRLLPADDDFKARFFQYKGALYAALNYKDGGVSQLFMEGDQGVVKNSPTPTTTTCTLDSGTATWAADEAIGSIFMIVAGTGSNQHKPFALITDNGATSGGETSLTYDALDVAPGSDSEIVIVGSQKWTEVTGHGWAAGEQVTGVLSVNHAVYFAMGDSVVMSRMRRYNSAGAWTTQWQDETGQFTHLEWANDQDGQYIWGAKGGYPSTVAKAPSIDCSGTGAASALTFESALNTGDVGVRNRSLTKYGEFANLHIMKEDNVMQVVPDDVIVPVGLAQMGQAADYRNGVASVVHKGYLYWSYHNTILRYYDGFLDNSDPATDDVGIPGDRVGACSGLASYENYLIATIDGGDNGYGSVIVYNGQGWSEWWRSPVAGKRVHSPFIQTLPGDNVDRLYFSCGSDLVNMPIATDPINFPNPVDHGNNYYHHFAFAMGASITLSYFYFGKQDSTKYYDSVRLIKKVGYNETIYMWYRLDSTLTWTQPYEYSFTTFHDTCDLSSDHSVLGRRINFLFSLDFDYAYRPAVIEAIVLKALVQQDVNEYVDLTALIEDNGMSLLEDVPDYYSSADSKVAAIKVWAATPQPALFRWHDSLLDNKYYKIDSPSLRATSILDELSGQMKHILAMRAYLVE